MESDKSKLCTMADIEIGGLKSDIRILTDKNTRHLEKIKELEAVERKALVATLQGLTATQAQAKIKDMGLSVRSHKSRIAELEAEIKRLRRELANLQNYEPRLAVEELRKELHTHVRLCTQCTKRLDHRMDVLITAGIVKGPSDSTPTTELGTCPRPLVQCSAVCKVGCDAFKTLRDSMHAANVENGRLEVKIEELEALDQERVDALHKAVFPQGKSYDAECCGFFDEIKEIAEWREFFFQGSHDVEKALKTEIEHLISHNEYEQGRVSRRDTEIERLETENARLKTLFREPCTSCRLNPAMSLVREEDLKSEIGRQKDVNWSNTGYWENRVEALKAKIEELERFIHYGK